MKLKGIDKILILGGAGFIGSHTVDKLISNNYHVTVLDSITNQVHGESDKFPNYMNKKCSFIRGDIRDNEIYRSLGDYDAILHLAAMVGVGQSMYNINDYVDVNTRGTAKLLDFLVNKKNDIKRLIVASSMSIYGEGMYHCENCDVYKNPPLRDEKQLREKQWTPTCPDCNSLLKSVPTIEKKPLQPSSIYAMTKRHQEEMCLLIGKTYGIPTVALRYFNVYGSRQALSNPYTGCVAIFSNRLMNNHPPYIFEDGNQTRDFIHVTDVAEANFKSLEKSKANYHAINVGSGVPLTIIKVSNTLKKIYNKLSITPIITNSYRKGDIRHCYADISKAKALLDFHPSTSLVDGMHEQASWVTRQNIVPEDNFEKALIELKKRNLAE